MRLSIIIPALNEADNILATLAPLQAMRARGAEVILVDGGSVDATKTLAAPLSDFVIDSTRGRATQMNAGARAAGGDALLFLHADSRLPTDADFLIKDALSRAHIAWGRFDVAIEGTHVMLPIIAAFMNARSRATGIATGDQGVFATRAAFEACDGFPDQPLMEDIEFSSQMKKFAPPICLADKIITSGRRWEKHGVWRTISLMWWLRLRYWLGASPAEIHRAYTK
jgi:rSAM/selenodomain-associated transferase 2